MKTLRVILAVLLAAVTGSVQAESISVADMKLTPGTQATIVINCEFTSADITAYQFELYLPDGVTLAKNARGRYADGTTYVLSERHDEHTMTLKDNTGFVKFVVSQNDKYTLTPGSGELLRLFVDVAETFTGEAQGEIKNFIMAEVDQTKHYMSDISFTMDVASQEVVTYAVGDTFTAPVPCGEGGTADLTFQVQQTEPWEVVVSSAPEDIAGALTIPATVTKDGTTFTVIAVADWVFYGRNGLTSVTIPESFVYIGSHSFRNCSGLTSVTVSGVLNNIWNFAFAECSSLESVTIHGLHNLSNYVFQSCTSLRSVTIQSVYTGNPFHVSNFQNTPEDVLFTIPDATAENLLKKGYKNLADKSGLTLVRNEFEAEATSIATMAEAFSDGDKTALTSAITNARTLVNSTEDYMVIYAQITAIKAAAKAFLTTATIAANTDVTAATITNPNMDRYAIGWDIPYMADSQGFMDSQYQNGDITIDKFVEVYKAGDGKSIDNGSISQTISNLPAGNYRLEVDLVAAVTDNAAETTGVSLFAGDKSIAVKTLYNEPQHFSLTFENKLTSDVWIGIKVSGTNANWVAADNFRLYYEGSTAIIPQGTDLVSDANARVYLYNVETGKFLNAGHAYGTHAVLSDTGLPVRLTQEAETGLWQVYFWEGSREQQLLFSVNGNAYVDYKEYEKNNPWWMITQNGDGSLLIRNQASGEGQYFGNDPTREDVHEGGYTDVTYTDVKTDVTNEHNILWVVMTEEQYLKYVNPSTPDPETPVEDTDISQLDNAIYIEATEGLVGSTIDLCVKVKNVLTPVGCSLKLKLPDGLSLKTDEDGDIIYTLNDRARKMNITSKNWGNGIYDFALTPSTGTATISGQDGIVITFKLQIPDDMVAGAYKVSLTNCLIQSKADGVTRDYELSDVVTTLTVEDYEPGDVNGDGNITPSDAIMILYRYFNVEQAGFNEKAADLNGDGNITPSDAIEALYLYFGSSHGNNAPRRMEPVREPE